MEGNLALYPVLRKDLILRYEPDYLGQGFYALRDTYNWQTHTFNKDGFLLLREIAKGCNLEQLARFISSQTSAQKKPAEQLSQFIAPLVAMGLVSLSDYPKPQPALLLSTKLRPMAVLPVSPMRFPTEVDLLLTAACNQRCKHCLIPLKPKRTKNELGTKEVMGLLDQLDRYGTFMVRFSGGEIFTRPDIHEILDYAASKRFGLRILSNATLFSPEVIQSCARIAELKNWGFVISVSLDGASAYSHDWLRSLPGSFIKTTRAIKALTESSVICTLETVLHKKNIRELDKLADLCLSLGVSGWNIHPVDHLNRATRNSDTLLDTPELAALAPQLETISKRVGGKIDMQIDYRHHTPFIKKIARHQFNSRYLKLPENVCQAGLYSMSIGPTGKIYPCNYAVGYPELEMGDMKQSSLLDLWHNPSWQKFRGGWQLRELTSCSSCTHNKLCGISHCRVYPAVTLKDFYGPMPECIEALK